MAPAYPKKKPVKPNVQMRQLHWAKIPDAKIKGTMWESDLTDEKVKLDIEEVENLFAANAAKKKDDKEEEGGGDGKDRPQDGEQEARDCDPVGSEDGKQHGHRFEAGSRWGRARSRMLSYAATPRYVQQAVSSSSTATALPSHSLTL